MPFTEEAFDSLDRALRRAVPFNDHPNDWQRFYGWIVEMHNAGLAGRPHGGDLREKLNESFRFAPRWVDALVSAYEHGLGVLEYLSSH